MRFLYCSETYCCYSYHIIYVRETLTFIIFERFLKTLLKDVVTDTDKNVAIYPTYSQ